MSSCYHFVDSLPRSCIEVKSVGFSQNDEYCISVDGSPTNGTMLFCADMETTESREFLTLPSGSIDNFSFTQKEISDSPFGRVEYEKIGLNLEVRNVLCGDLKKKV